MEITIIRHGRSKCTEKKRVKSSDFMEWAARYDGEGVFEEVQYPSDTLDQISTAGVVFSSHLSRSVESANLLNAEGTVSDPLFREAELPQFNIDFLKVKMNPGLWAVSLRVMWLLGYSKGCESYRSTKRRALQAADKLIESTESHQTVVLVGHGFFNRMIARELRRKGWSGRRRPGTKHWKCTSYSLIKQRDSEVD